MSQRTDVDPAELRASAGACDDIARTMKGPADKAVREAGTAGGSLSGWSVGPALTEIATSWKPALDGLHARVQAGGDNLRSSADGHEWNDDRVSQDFEKTGADTATQATPGAMPAVLRPSGGERHPVGHPGSAPGFDPGGRPSGGDGALDPRTSYGTNMPTYDETVGTRPTPGTNDFG
ncbi:WXG100 family type VII secretion target [Streptomyces fulvoviolaceus]|uniref:WXG100 family type VII secretion target n=1 Tax=Streptomyces fulvoviolaceus TaxID=285535 RepID=UPI000694EC46|nr:type VII secretion target [Streptomyces fulvoviolaceus]